MADTLNNGKNGNGTWRNVLIGFVTILVSIGGSLYTTGQSSGQQIEKTSQLEAKVAIIEVKKDIDHDLLIYLKSKVDSMEKEQKRQGDILDKHFGK